MKWSFNNDRPIYTQLIEQIKLGILSGTFTPGSQLPSVRDMALDAEVNPNTMQKALAKLEDSKLVYSERTSGRYVTKDNNMIEQLRNDMANEQTKIYLDGIKKLGMTKQEIMAIIQEAIKEDK